MLSRCRDGRAGISKPQIFQTSLGKYWAKSSTGANGSALLKPGKQHQLMRVCLPYLPGCRARFTPQIYRGEPRITLFSPQQQWKWERNPVCGGTQTSVPFAGRHGKGLILCPSAWGKVRSKPLRFPDTGQSETSARAGSAPSAAALSALSSHVSWHALQKRSVFSYREVFGLRPFNLRMIVLHGGYL